MSGSSAAPAESLARVFTRTDGDIKAMLREILYSSEFNEARGAKFKRPFHFIVSSLRALGANTHAHQPLIEYLLRMGQAPFQHPTPDGYPDEAAPWLGTLLWRWNFALALASNQAPSVVVSLPALARAIGGEFKPEMLLPHFIGRAGTDLELHSLNEYVTQQGLETDGRRAELIGLILASPAFQRY